MTRFVVQEHFARTHHFDFRLERGGVFKSWAVPKGLPETSGTKRLAVQVEDHDISFGNFEGTIPEGQYGAGEVRIWDEGTYEPMAWAEHSITFIFNGAKIHGVFNLVKFRRGSDRNWLLYRPPASKESAASFAKEPD